MTSETRVDLQHVCFQGRNVELGRRGLGLTTRFVRRRVLPGHLPPDCLDPDPGDGFGHWVLARAGLDAAAYLGQPLQRRTAACLRALRVSSADAGRDLLRRRPELLRAAVSALLIPVTAFWRDGGVFDDMRTHVLPALADRRGPLRVWSAGCSSGAELYTVAILLAEAGLLGKTALVGTDCRPDAIAEARASRYGAAALDGLSDGLRHRYFVASGDRWAPAERLRRHVHWKVADLSRQIEPGSWDVILCRNVAIYLNRQPAERMFTAMAAALRPGGFLVVGKAERPPAQANLVLVRRCIYRQSGDQHVDQ